MSHATAMEYKDDMPLSKPTKAGIKVIDYMPTRRIVGFLMYRHRVGLLSTGNAVLLGYMAWDKIGRLFF